jgi:hypothetical protein
MRILLVLTALMLPSCNNAEQDPHVFIVRVREPQRINGCNVYIDSTHDDHVRGKPRRNAYMQTICGVPESTLKGQWWWGDGLQPPGFALGIGDCMPLDNIYYCLEDVVHYESAKFRATYEKPDHPKGNLTRIR